jgi:large subunit ribosomal protein L1
VLLDDFGKYDKKKAKKLAEEYSFFVAQANLMTQVASAFGKVLGSRGKMPNPKAGCVVPINANLGALAERLRKTVRIKVDANPIYQVAVGIEDMDDNQIVDNVMTVYNALIHALPNDVHNIKNAYLKLTMGDAYKIGEEHKAPQPAEKKASKEAKKEEPKKSE